MNAIYCGVTGMDSPGCDLHFQPQLFYWGKVTVGDKQCSEKEISLYSWFNSGLTLQLHIVTQNIWNTVFQYLLLDHELVNLKFELMIILFLFKAKPMISNIQQEMSFNDLSIRRVIIEHCHYAPISDLQIQHD